MSGKSLLHKPTSSTNSHPNGTKSLLASQRLPEELQNAYKEIKALCENMSTPLRIHSYARELYETVYHFGEFVTEPRKAVIASCLFIAYKAKSTDRILQEHKMFYRERSLLAPATDHDALAIIAALDRFFIFKAPKALIVDGGEILYDFAIRQAQRCRVAVMEDGSVDDTNSVANDPIKPLLAVYKTIENFCNCLAIPSRISSRATTYTKSLYEAVHHSGGFEADEQAAVIAGYFYVALRQLEVPHALREVWIVSGVPGEEVEAVVKDLEDFFAENIECFLTDDLEYLAEDSVE